MFCPECRAEYREGFTECADCKVPLVPELPPEPEPEYVEFATVLETGNPAIIAMAKSVLEAAGIECFAKGEGLQELFAAGGLGAHFNPVTGPVEIQVRLEDEEEARKLLDDLEESDSDGDG